MPGYADRHPWQAYGEPSGGGWTTVRASCATTEIGVRSGCRPHTPSAALGNECGDPTHDRVAEFRLAVCLLGVQSLSTSQVTDVCLPRHKLGRQTVDAYHHPALPSRSNWPPELIADPNVGAI